MGIFEVVLDVFSFIRQSLIIFYKAMKVGVKCHSLNMNISHRFIS